MPVMFNTVRLTERIASISRITATVVLAMVWLIGCISPQADVTASFAGAPASLLHASPYTGEENKLRDPLPELIRLTVDNESVAGWLSPPEKLLRFPVELRENTHLTLSIGAITETITEVGDLVAIIEYRQFDPVNGSPGSIDEIYRCTFGRGSNWMSHWTHADIDLSEWGQSRGELCFRLDGPLAGNRDVDVLWGQPALYCPDERERKNVLLIGVDTMRHDTCPPFDIDPEITPNIADLCKESTLFTRAWSQAPWTLPSFASIITGGYPSSINATGYNECLPSRATTLAEIVQMKGFATQTICSNPWLGNADSGFHQGMDGLWFLRNGTADVSVEKAKEFITRNKNRDWFCFLHFQDPHTSYEPPREFIDRFCDPAYEGEHSDGFRTVRIWDREGFRPDNDDLKQVRNLYHGEIAFVDECIGDLFNWMDGLGLTNETMIVFTSDHGEEFFEHDRFGHGQSHYDELVRVPLIVKGPDFPMGGIIDTPVACVDIFPTILGYLGLPVPDGLPGSPLSDIVGGDIDENRIIYGEECGEKSIKFAVEWPYKLILDFVTSETELYDLSTDPFETDNISERHQDIVQRLSSEIITNMIPSQPLFLMAIIGNPDDPQLRFTGTLSIPGGFEMIRPYALNEGDTFAEKGNVIEFDITSTRSDRKFTKILAIWPSRDSYELEAAIMLNGSPPFGRFFPYGTSTPEPSGKANINMMDFPWPASLPPDYRNGPSACYLLTVPGIYPDDSLNGLEYVEHDRETIEQLKALGYLN